jgi:hypothetical protein
MPIMGGLEATQHIRAHEKLFGIQRTPIIALTAHAMIGDRERCLQAGMDDHVTSLSRSLPHELVTDHPCRTPSSGRSRWSHPQVDQPSCCTRPEPQTTCWRQHQQQLVMPLFLFTPCSLYVLSITSCRSYIVYWDLVFCLISCLYHCITIASVSELIYTIMTRQSYLFKCH